MSTSPRPGLIEMIGIQGMAIIALVAGIIIALIGRAARQIGVQGMAIIAMMAALHFVVSYVSRFAGTVLIALTGPYAIYLQAIGSEGVACILVAVTVVLLPRVGALSLLLLTVALLNGIFAGAFGAAPLLFIAASIVIHEAILAALCVTVGPTVREPAVEPSNHLVVRIAVAIGLANGLALAAQYILGITLYRLYFTVTYVLSVSLVSGFLFGAIGAAIGTILGYRLRRTAL